MSAKTFTKEFQSLQKFFCLSFPIHEKIVVLIEGNVSIFCIFFYFLTQPHALILILAFFPINVSMDFGVFQIGFRVYPYYVAYLD
jgi:hypothetical protein